MPLRRKRARSFDAITISSSSDTSEASEDSAPESDPDSPSKRGGIAAKNDMSERQTMKLQSGSFGMFNHPTLMPKTPPRSPGSAKKRNKAREYSASQKPPQMRARKERKSKAPEVLELEREVEESLFIPDHTARSQPITVDGSEHEESLYSGMTSERAAKAREYIDTLGLLETAEERLRLAEEKLSAMATEHTDLTWKLATIDAAADNKIADILTQRDEAIRLANEHAEEKIKRVRERLPARKRSYEGRLRDVDARREGMEGRVTEAKAELEGVKERKDGLQREGGFELCSDVRDVQERCRR